MGQCEPQQPLHTRHAHTHPLLILTLILVTIARILTHKLLVILQRLTRRSTSSESPLIRLALTSIGKTHEIPSTLRSTHLTRSTRERSGSTCS